MKTVADIIKAANGMLAANFPAIPRYSSDKDKNIKYPCFMIRYDAVTDTKPDFRHDNGQIRVYYFPENMDQNRLELLEMRESLAACFRYGITAADLFIPINELTFEMDADILQLSMDWDLFQQIDVDKDAPYMEQLEF